jgi:Branched-chain amino acid ABC-type transport system, permease components
MLTTVLQLIISGIATGFIYSLVATEYTLVFNSTALLNFGHDKFIMLGAYIMLFTFVKSLGMPYIPAILITLIVMFLLGIITAYGIFNPLRTMSSRLYAGIGTLVLGRIIQEASRLFYGAIPAQVAYLSGVVTIFGLRVTRANIAIIVFSTLIIVSLTLFLQKTKTGKAMRCINQNKTAAALMGINVTWHIAFITGISIMICGVLGVLIAPLVNVSTTMSGTFGTKGFAAGIIGGFGNLPGAIIGGLLLGVVENLSVLVLPAVYKDIVSYVIMIAFLLIKPTGLMGEHNT